MQGTKTQFKVLSLDPLCTETKTHTGERKTTTQRTKGTKHHKKEHNPALHWMEHNKDRMPKQKEHNAMPNDKTNKEIQWQRNTYIKESSTVPTNNSNQQQ